MRRIREAADVFVVARFQPIAPDDFHGPLLAAIGEHARFIFHNRGGTCWQPRLKGLTLMVNSIYNGYRFEDIWLDK
jgi:hypothetical protein